MYFAIVRLRKIQNWNLSPRILCGSPGNQGFSPKAYAYAN
jgi:hypothetical protein